MKTRFLGIALSAVCAASAALAIPPATVVVPSSATSTDACANNVAPWSSGNFGVVNAIRYQQVYAASEFTAAGSALQVTAISFRSDAGTGGPNTGSVPFLQLRLSTTSAAVDALSGTFASNPGADETLVYGGPFSVTWGGGTIGSVRPFDVTITLATPFVYHPANGNLLLDVQISGGSTSSFYALDAVAAGPPGSFCGGAAADTTSRVRGVTDNDFTTGSPDTYGLVTQFTFGSTPVELQRFRAE